MQRRHFMKTAAASAALLGGAQFGLTSTALAAGKGKVELFAHRGASALRPEHTLAAYAKAIADGADYIEPDLVITKDGVLVARHEAFLSETTDVASRPEFAGKRASKSIDGRPQEGWFVEDFTLAELKTLRAVERLPKVRPQNTAYDGMFQILTWEEIIDFAAAHAATTGQVIGLIPELKHSTYFKSVGLPLEDRFLNIIAAHEYTRRCPLEIQSFEVANLKYVRSVLGKRHNVRIMQLVERGDVRPADVVAAGGDLTFGKMCSKQGLRDIASYADVVAPPTRALIPLLADGKLGQPTSLIADAHDAGLLVHTWTFRPENRFLAADFRDDKGEDARNEKGSVAEMQRYIAAGIDGLFSDDSALGRRAINNS
ncbi:glycerophosphodiester phosphodiesterase [Undibacterium sp. CY18W]|uniref:glycerophosphodiester phosphodiesterase n=2 Tax=Undibacterium hunanense TaxID=2762292 RepID=A0ABR6ZWZ2_9BURK|nr:glycerophosphodiester phosphodiesterase [Undibacterium hunanense]